MGREELIEFNYRAVKPKVLKLPQILSTKTLIRKAAMLVDRARFKGEEPPPGLLEFLAKHNVEIPPMKIEKEVGDGYVARSYTTVWSTESSVKSSTQSLAACP